MSHPAKFGLVSLITLVLLASLLFFLQTRQGFRHVIIPIASKLTGAKLMVRDGRFSLMGSLEVDGLVYDDPATGISVDSERLALRASPWSIISEDGPKIDSLELKRANLRIVGPSEPSMEPVRKAKSESVGTFPLLPVAIERANFEDVVVTVERGNRRLTARATATLDHLGPGRSGTVTLRTGFLLERGDMQDLSGSIDLHVSVDIGPGGNPISWNGSNQVFVRTGRGSLEATDPGVLYLKQTLTGDYEQVAQNLRASSNVTIRRVNEELGTVELIASLEGAKQPAVTNASLKIAGITGDTLNLWLGKTGTTHVDEGRFDALIEAHIEGTRTSVRGNMTGSAVQLRMGDRDASPPVDISLQHVGSFDSATSEVALETLTLKIGDKVKTLLSGELSRPVTLRLDQPAAGTQSPGTGIEPALLSLRLMKSDLQDLRPWLALLGRDPLKGVTAGTLEGTLLVSIYEQGAVIDVAGKVESTEMMLQGKGSGRNGVVGPLGFIGNWKSRLTGIQLLTLDPLTTSISLKGKQVAALEASGTVPLADAAAIFALKGTVKLIKLPGETLNPLLGLWSLTRIDRAQIDGHADVTVGGDRARWDVDLVGQGFRVRLPNQTSDAPPLDLLIKQAGEFDQTARELRLEKLNVEIVEKRRPVVMISLSQALTLNFAKGDGEKASKSGESSEPIMLGLRVNRLSVDQLRPWVALTGSQALASVQRGTLDADLKIRFSGADDIAATGRLDLDTITFKHSEMRESESVSLSNEIQASIVGRSRVTLNPWAVRAMAGKKLLAQARVVGATDPGGATNLALDVAASNISELIGRLGLLTERQRRMISGGSLKGNVSLVTSGPKEPLTITTDLRSENLKIRLDKAHELSRTLGVQAKVGVDGARTLAEIQRMRVSTWSGEAQGGTLTATGRWPLIAGGTSTPAGAVGLMVQDWDSGPFVDFFELLPGRRPGPLPVAGELTVTQEAGGKTIAVKGKETIGPITVAMNGGDSESATVQLEHDVAQSGDEIRMATLTLEADRTKGRNDRIAMSGSLRTGPRPKLLLHGSVDALDTDWYTALTTSPSERAPTDEISTKSQGTKDSRTGFAVPLDLDVDLAIGTVTYRTLEIGKGRLVAKGDGNHMQAMLEPTGLAHGSVQSTVTIALKDGQPHFTWNAKGSELDVGLLTKAAFAEPEPRVTGRAKFTTSGTGQGQELHESLEGTVIFDVQDGRLKSPLMDFLAEQTRIDEFRELGFKTFHGELHIKDGWVQLNKVRADSASIALEAGGKIALDGRLDALVQPKIGPTLSNRTKIPCLDQFMKTPDGFTVLPVAVAVKGTAGKPTYGARVTPGNVVGRQAGTLVGTVADVLTGCRGGESAHETTEEAVGKVKDATADLFKDLFGRKKKQ